VPRAAGNLLVALVLSVVTVTPGLTVARQQPLGIEDRWVEQVRTHTPGALDEPARQIATLSWTTLRPILDGVLGHGDDVILLGSAMLLTDVAVHVPVTDRPLTTNDGHAIISRDGDTRGIAPLDPHLAWSRRLVDRLVADSGAPRHREMRAHAIAWYRTVSAVLASRSNLADLEPHIQQSLERFPEDAGIVFDAGCYYETYTSPGVQASIAAGLSARSRTLRPTETMRMSAPSQQVLLTNAEKQFRRVLDLDGSFAEARARLAHVLMLRGRLKEAVLEARQAAATAGDQTVRYFAHLFLGEASRQLGDRASAVRSFGEAARIFPRAQSAQLALSHIAGEERQTAEARSIVERMLSERTEADVDPWWIYYRASGREAETILQSFADRVRGVTAAGIQEGGPR
jgi:tetratricopeptide (TPR) repeat protein